MAYTPYTSVSVSGYNSTPPPDDGSTGSNNQINWAGIRTNLTDPLDTAFASLDTNIAAAFALRVFRAKSTQSSDYTLVSADYGKILACTGNPTITMPDASTVGEGWAVTILNIGTGKVLLDGGAATINGVNVIELSNANDYAVVMSDGSNFVGPVTRSIGQAGVMIHYAGASTAPNGTLSCDGSTIGDASSGASYTGEKYRTLFNLLKTGWGNLGTENFDSHNTVALPNAIDRFPVGSGSTFTWGATGGTFTIGQTHLPSLSLTVTGTAATHTHTGTTTTGGAHTHTVGSSDMTGGGNTTLRPTGSGTPTNITDGGTHNHTFTSDASGALTLTATAATGGSGTSFVPKYFAGLWCVVY